jgi:hypothetical protein
MRLSVLALAGLLALPAAAAAQDPLPPGQLPPARFSVTPFVGMRVPYSTGNAYLFTGDGRSFVINEDRGGGALAGVEGEARVRGPLSVLGSLAYSNAGDYDIRLTSGEGEQIPLIGDTPDTWMAKLAVAYRLPEPRPDNRRFHPAGFLSVGPSLVRTNWADSDLDGSGDNHWGLNLGVHTATTLGTPRLALNLGIEDYLTFWDTERLAAHEATLYGDFFEDTAAVDFDYSSSNLVMLRLGLSFRFQ